MLKQTPRATPRIKSDRVSFDRAAANAILDEAPICHVGFVVKGAPMVIPTIHWRIGDRLFFHGSRGSRLAAGQDLCVTVTLVDGLVLARSAFHHSMNYRSVILFGQAGEIVDDGEKTAAFDALMDKMTPGRRAHVRPPSDKERSATKLLSLAIDEGSVKIRRGPPVDAEDDMAWPVWAGVLPLALTQGRPITDERSLPGITAGKPGTAE
jgi:hypothetical protein